MAERKSYHPGEPCWADVTAPDPEAARRFYQAVFGWEFMVSGPSSAIARCAPSAARRSRGSHPHPGAGRAGPWSWIAPDVDDAVAKVSPGGTS
jgi:predicted enzyme related to lactoylglutathione lyase